MIQTPELLLQALSKLARFVKKVIIFIFFPSDYT